MYITYTYTWKKLPERRSYEKCTRIKLMKLTAGFYLHYLAIISNHRGSIEADRSTWKCNSTFPKVVTYVHPFFFFISSSYSEKYHLSRMIFFKAKKTMTGEKREKPAFCLLLYQLNIAKYHVSNHLRMSFTF